VKVKVWRTTTMAVAPPIYSKMLTAVTATYDEGDAVDGGGGIVDGSDDESARNDGDADDAAKKKKPVDFAKWGCLVGQVPSVVRKVSLEKAPVEFAKAPSRAGLLTAPGGTKLGFAKPITSVPPPLPPRAPHRLHRPTPNLHLYLRCRSRLLRI
jgi:hypothetical protein